jgi:hypothetical protein
MLYEPAVKPVISGVSVVTFAEPLLPLDVPVQLKVPVANGPELNTTSIDPSDAPQLEGFELTDDEITGVSLTTTAIASLP